MPVPTTDPRKNPDESDKTQTQPQGKKGKRKSLIKVRMLARASDADRKVSNTQADEPAALDVATSEKPTRAPGAIGNSIKRKSKKEGDQKDGRASKATVNERSGRLARFWGTLFACFGTRALPVHDEKNAAGRVDNSSLSSSQETAHQAPSKKDKDIVDEKGIIRAEGAERLKEKVEDTASSRLTAATGASPTTDSNGVTTSQAAQKAQSNASDSTTKPATSPFPSISIPPLPLVVTTPVHTPHTPTVPGDAEDTDTVIVPPTPSRISHTLPLEETQGLTAGAVVPPGATADDYHQNAVVGGDDSEGTSFTDDEFHDAPEEDMEAEEARLVANGGSGIPSGPDGKPKPLLPPMADRHKGRKCLVLDMDETLLHSSFKLMPTHDFTVAVEIEWQWHNAYVLKRPGVEEFLRRMGEVYEVVVYTASVSKYADPVLDKVDVHKAVTHRLFRESCYSHRGNYVKDLSMLGRPLADCIILDNSPASYLFNPSNAVPVMTWFNDPHDTELTDLIGFLSDLATSQDVRGILARNL